MLTPQDITSSETNETTDVIKANLTFKTDFDKNKIIGKTDGKEAVEQAVILILSTDLGYSEIYRDYGIKTSDLIGKDFSYVASEMRRRITESLLEDDRITGTDNFEFYSKGEYMSIKFDVRSIFGEFAEEGEYKV